MSSESKIPEEFTFTWRIENYSFCYHKTGDYIQSRLFLVENLGRSKWYLSFYPKGKCPADEYFHCCLYAAANDEAEDVQTIVSIKIDIISSDGEILESNECEEAVYTRSCRRPQRLSVKMRIDDIAKKMENCKEDTLIIRCCFTGDETRRKRPIRYELNTRIGVDRCLFPWNVANFNFRSWAVTQKLWMDSYIQITLTAPEDAFLINIRKCENPTVIRFATCRVSLLDVEGVERHSKKYTHLFEDKTWKFPSFITKTQLNSERGNFLKNGTFTFIFEFSISSEMHSEMDFKPNSCSPVNAFLPEDTFSRLKEDLRNMFTSKKHSDVKLCAGREIFPVHKSVLAARSPVFSAMFDHNMLESQTGIVDIPDMDAETLNSFLSFMYTGTVDKMDYEVILKLLLAADKYEVESLMNKCASYLTSDLSDSKALEVLVIADTVGYKLLKESVHDYIKTRARKILPSRGWSQWIEKNVRLASEVLSKLSVEFGSSDDQPYITVYVPAFELMKDVPPISESFPSPKDYLRSIFNGKKHSDVELRVGDDIFPAHKAILSARSPVFSAMFDRNMLESQTGIVDIPDMDAETLNSFLSFMYTERVALTDYKVTLKLLVAADKYQVVSLKEKCVAFFGQYMSDETACEVLIIADRIEDKLLKKFVQNYIKDHAEKILSSPEWSQWIEKNARLAIEILLKMSVEFGSFANEESEEEPPVNKNRPTSVQRSNTYDLIYSSKRFGRYNAARFQTDRGYRGKRGGGGYPRPNYNRNTFPNYNRHYNEDYRNHPHSERDERMNEAYSGNEGNSNYKHNKRDKNQGRGQHTNIRYNSHRYRDEHGDRGHNVDNAAASSTESCTKSVTANVGKPTVVKDVENN